MARRASTHPTDGELEILNVLWDEGTVSLGRIRERLRAQRDVATTTIATMLKVMLEKGLVRREQGERGYAWSAVATRRKTANGLVRKVVDAVFHGSAQRLVAHLVESGQLTDRELDELRTLVSGKGDGQTGKRR